LVAFAPLSFPLLHSLVQAALVMIALGNVYEIIFFQGWQLLLLPAFS
jgi:hypothetical protein